MSDDIPRTVKTTCQKCKGYGNYVINLKDRSGKQNHGCGIDHIVGCEMCDGKGYYFLPDWPKILKARQAAQEGA